MDIAVGHILFLRELMNPKFAFVKYNKWCKQKYKNSFMIIIGYSITAYATQKCLNGVLCKQIIKT